MQENLIYFTKYDTVISSFYGELPTQQFLEKFKKDIEKNKFESARFNDDTYSSATSNHYSICSIRIKRDGSRYYLVTEKDIKQDLDNCIATDDTIKINKFLKLLEIQKDLDNALAKFENVQRNIQEEKTRKAYLIALADKGTIESEEAKELYLDHLKKNSNFFIAIYHYLREVFEREDSFDGFLPFIINSISFLLFPIFFPIDYIVLLKLNSHKIKAIIGKDYPKIDGSNSENLLKEQCQVEDKAKVLITDAIIGQIRKTYILTNYINEIDKTRIQTILKKLTEEYLQKKHNLNQNNDIVLETLALKRYVVDILVNIELEINAINKRDMDFNQAASVIGEPVSWQLKKQSK